MPRVLKSGSLYDMALSLVSDLHALVRNGGKWDKDRIHAVRLAIRRLNGVMELCHWEGVPVPLSHSLVAAFKELGKARDLDRAIAIIRAQKSAKHSKRAISHLKTKRDKHRIILSKKALYTSIEKTCEALSDELKYWRRVEPVPIPNFESLLTRHIFEKDYIADMSSIVILANLDDTSLHKRRIKIKKLRYMLEVVRGVPVKTLKRLQSLQSRLGDLHDIHVARKLAARNGGSGELDKALAREAEILRKTPM